MGQGSLGLRSLDQFYSYIEKREKGTSPEEKANGEKKPAAKAKTPPPAPGSGSLRYTLRNGVTIPIVVEQEAKSSPPAPGSVPPAVEVGEAITPEAEAGIEAVTEPVEAQVEESTLRDEQDAAAWRALPRSVRLLTQLTHENVASIPMDAMGERRHLIDRLLNPMLTLEDTARLLGVCPATVRRWANKGALPTQRTIGQQRRFFLADVLICLEEREQEAAAGKNGAGRHS